MAIKIVLTTSLFLISFSSSFAQCDLNFSDNVMFPFTGDIVNGDSGGANESATHDFDIWDEGSAPLSCGIAGGMNDITFDFNIIHAIDLYGIDGVIDAYAGSTHDITQSSGGFKGTVPLK